MANSLITRCPKCSTAFRVSDEVLSMAKGKVRCGQCFHIFNAAHGTTSSMESNTAPSSTASTPKQTAINTAPSQKQSNQAHTTDSRLAPAEETINPDWLHTLFNDEDLQPSSQPTKKQKQTEIGSQNNRPTHSDRPLPAQETSQKTTNIKGTTNTARPEELAPWEVELAEVEAALRASPAPLANQSTSSTNSKPLVNPNPLSSSREQLKPIEEETHEPDYMVALHSLAQTAAEQARPSDIKNRHTILEQLSAQESLAPLLGESDSTKTPKKGHPWLWFFATLLGAMMLITQVAMHYFDEGSRSAHFRAFYKTICSYTGCVLPRFEDINAISIQHVRIQSHPTIPNTLLVNAIITNTSDFSQPMPKIALEFFDLNGLPVAARLFAPSNYLHKDFLDITYMPPNTPIHLVIPIQDPGARAVTHQLRAFPADTRSY